MSYASAAFGLFQQFMSLVSIGSLVFAISYGLFHKETDDDHHPWK